MPKIKNFKKLAINPFRKSALDIIEAGLAAIDTKEIIKKTVQLDNKKLIIKDKEYSLQGIKRIFVVGVGKCSLEAGMALEEILGKRLKGGIVLDVHQGSLNKIKAFKGDHPLPSLQNVGVTEKIITLLSGLMAEDLVIFVVSGGGSTLLCQPKGISYLEEADIMRQLTRAGADIGKINTVRKHLSLARGGFLAKYAYPAKVVSLIFSDVPGHSMEFVSSGPTIKDTTTISDAREVLWKYNTLKDLNLFKIDLIETPKHGKYFRNIDNVLVVSNEIALRAMADKALKLGFQAEIVTGNFSGEARNLGREFARELSKKSPKTALLYGGESTVTVRGDGKGGRNQELALSALRYIKDDQLMVSVASDGRDNCELAGAICDIISRIKVKNLGLNIEKYLENNDSYGFFNKIGDYLLTGDTGSNVSDLVVAIKR